MELFFVDLDFLIQFIISVVVNEKRQTKARSHSDVIPIYFVYPHTHNPGKNGPKNQYHSVLLFCVVL